MEGSDGEGHGKSRRRDMVECSGEGVREALEGSDGEAYEEKVLVLETVVESVFERIMERVDERISEGKIERV